MGDITLYKKRSKDENGRTKLEERNIYSTNVMRLILLHGIIPRKPSALKEERKGDRSIVEEVEKIGGGKKTGGGGSFSSSSSSRKDSSTINQVSTVSASERSSMGTASPSNPKGPSAINLEDQLESTKTEMREVREDNDRLKALLARVVKDYQSLQMHFFDTVHHDQAKKEAPPQEKREDVDEPHGLISLSLGTSSSGQKKEEKTNITNKSNDNGDQIIEEGLTLALDCKFEQTNITTKSNDNATSMENNETMSPSNSIEEANKEEEEAGEPWPPSKILKNMRSRTDLDEVLQQTPAKKTRVSVRARCDAPTMHDGCQWRKYGQKIAKGNPCPRAYYRCTVAPACPVRKQVQRCAEDMSILITTYEGTHSHPLPVSATAMAATTAAAACMLMSGSIASSSSVSIADPTIINSFNSLNPHALNFGLLNPNSQSRSFFLPNPTISSTPSYPTITLDLTSTPQTTSQTPQFSTRFPSGYSTSFNFSSTDSNPRMPPAWPSWPHLGNATQQASFKRSPIAYQPYIQKIASPSPICAASSAQHVLTDTIAQAITSNPSFQSALAAAITSYVGGPTGAQSGLDGARRSPLAPYSLLPTLAFSGSKSTPASPKDNRENIN